MDESHRLKSPSGQISRWASQIADRSVRRLALTGTPMPHSPMDIYAQYRAVDKTIFGVSYQEFKNRYAEFEIVGARAATNTYIRLWRPRDRKGLRLQEPG